ncbi:MAG: hypothetical protein MJE63_15375 [Proteobacteria bacterium]|nr:hypothetical protein [Pseudomonadota bacterium]
MGRRSLPIGGSNVKMKDLAPFLVRLDPPVKPEVTLFMTLAITKRQAW